MEAEDARHDTPPRPMPDWSSTRAPVDAPAVTTLAWSELPRADLPTMTWGLQFLDNGRVFSDLGRWSKRTELDDVDTLDLRVILQHLDSAALAVRAALDERYGR